jgi:hypothetical protein
MHKFNLTSFLSGFKPWKKDDVEKIIMKNNYRRFIHPIFFVVIFLGVLSITIYFSIINFLLFLNFQITFSFLFLVLLFLAFLIPCFYLTITYFRRSIESVYITYWYKHNSNRKLEIFAEILKRYLHFETLSKNKISSMNNSLSFLFGEIMNDTIDEDVSDDDIEVFGFMRRVLSKELPMSLSFKQDSKKIISNLENLIKKLESKIEIKNLYKDVFEIHKFYKKNFDIKSTNGQKYESGFFQKLYHQLFTPLLAVFLFPYLIFFLTTGYSPILEQQVIDGNTTKYYEYNFAVKYGAFIPSIENFEIELPFQSFDSSVTPSPTLSAEGCKIIESQFNMIVHCDRIYKDGYLFISWKSNEKLPESIKAIPYTIANIKITPIYIFPKISSSGIKNITSFTTGSSFPQCPKDYVYSDGVCKLNIPGIVIKEIFPLRNSFYSETLAIVRFQLIGTGKGTYTFITKWHNSTQLLDSSSPTESSLQQFTAWQYWYPTSGNNDTWIFNLQLNWGNNETDANTTFLVIKNNSLTQFLTSTQCILLDYTELNSTIDLISWNSRDDLSQSKDLLSFIRQSDISNSYNSAIQFVSKARLIGIPARIVLGKSEIGTEHYWTEIFHNETWIPVDVSSDYAIGNYSTIYNYNTTILPC